MAKCKFCTEETNMEINFCNSCLDIEEIVLNNIEVVKNIISYDFKTVFITQELYDSLREYEFMYKELEK